MLAFPAFNPSLLLMLAVCVSNTTLISALTASIAGSVGSAKNSFILLTPAIADCIVWISIPRLSTGANICDM